MRNLASSLGSPVLITAGAFVQYRSVQCEQSVGGADGAQATLVMATRSILGRYIGSAAASHDR